MYFKYYEYIAAKTTLREMLLIHGKAEMTFEDQQSNYW